MTVLVTGGAGFIGSAFLRWAAARWPGRRLVNLDALTYAGSTANLTELEGLPHYVFEQVDLANAQDVDRAFRRHRPELVVHFAAETHVDRSIADGGAFVRTNVLGTQVLLDAFRRHVGRDGLFHHVGTDEVYGSVAEGACREDSPYRPTNPYSASKAASDHLVRAWAHTFGLRARITLCTNNFGPRQFPEKLIPLMILNAVEGRRLPVYGAGVNQRDWLHVDDHCEAIGAVVERGADGETYNVGSGVSRRNLDVVHGICEAVAEETGQDAGALRALVEHVPDRPGHDLRYAVDTARIRAVCGWSPRTGFKEGLRATVRWYLSHPQWVAAVGPAAYRRRIAYGAEG